MLLRVGVIMVVIALALAAGATAMVVLRAEEPAPANTPTEPLAVETKAQENKPDLGKKLEIDDEPDEKPEVTRSPRQTIRSPPRSPRQIAGPPRRRRRSFPPSSARPRRYRSPSKTGRGLRGGR
jgi:hypothetical protein